MDLKTKDVAELLNISEKTVEKWIAEGKIPAYQIDQEYRFSPSEIEDWIMEQKLGVQFEPDRQEAGNMQYGLYRAINRGGVLDQLQGVNKQQIISQTMDYMAKNFELDAAVLTDLFLDRERMMSTALGHGIAVPHTRDFLIDTHFDVITVVYPKQPIEFGALDGEPVHTLFFLFASEDRHHLQLLAKLAHINVGERAREFFKSRPSKQELLDFIKRWEGSLSP